MWCDLDARDEVALLDDLAVEHREDLERVEAVEPFELGDEDVDDARGRGDEVEPALVRAADVEVRAGDGASQPDRGVVLVKLSRLDDDDADRRPGIGAGDGREVVGAQPATLRPAFPGDRQVAREDGPFQASGGAPTKGDPLDAHAGTRPKRPRSGSSGRARLRSRGGCRPPPCSIDSRGPRRYRC